MLLNYNKVVAYICPSCSGISMDTIQIFNFSGKGKHSLVCAECSDKCVTIEQKKDKYKISIECPICECTHTYSSKAGSFWHNDFTCYKCPEAGINIYFQGNYEQVTAALKEQEEFLSDMADEQQEIWGSELLINEMARYLQFLASSDAVICSCGSLDIQMDVNNNCIVLECSDCGASETFYPDEESITSLMSRHEIVLEYDDNE